MFENSWTPFGLQGGRSIEGEACNSLKDMVARDGIEPPTPAFSGVAAIMLICLISLVLFIFNTLKTARLLEQ